jgi:prolyl 4-hydroxylase
VFSKYEALCRGERKESQSSNPNLKCSYRASKDLYYVIGPVKQEVVSQSPMILVFHDVIHENEIKRIQQLAIPNVRLIEFCIYNRMIMTDQYVPFID